MNKITAFLDTNVLLSVFGGFRNGRNSSYIIDSNIINRITFEKCIFESYLAFRGIGGKKPDEGRGDWAKRYLNKESDPIPLGNAIGQLHQGSLFLAHFWVGQADESQYALPENYEEYMEDIQKHICEEDWKVASADWEKYQKIIMNHNRYQILFSEFRDFLEILNCCVISYEELYKQANYHCRLRIMESMSIRSTIPSEDFEIVVAALVSKPDIFVTTDRRLITASMSIEQNIRFCDFVHLNDVNDYVKSYDRITKK